MSKSLPKIENGMMPKEIVNFMAVTWYQYMAKITIRGSVDFFKMQRKIFPRLNLGKGSGRACNTQVHILNDPYLNENFSSKLNLRIELEME